MGFKGGPHMQCDKPRANKWGRPNLVCIMEEKTFEAKKKLKKKTRWANKHVPFPNPTQDLKHAQSKSKGKLKKDARKRNGHPIFLKCFLEINLHPFLQIAQDVVHTTLPPEEKLPCQPQVGLE